MSVSPPSFEEDMRLIREKRNVSREMLHQQTKVALENIELFEEGDLDRHPHFNDVYLRALVRAYAEVLGISKEMVLQALERSRAGVYRGELGDRYLDREPTPADVFETPAADQEADRPIDDEGAGDEQRAETGESAREEREPIMSAPETQTPDADRPEETTSDSGQTSGTPAEASAEDESSAESPGGSGGRSSPVQTGVAQWLVRDDTGKIVVGVAGLVLIVLVVWTLASFLVVSSPPAPTLEEGGAAADTVDTTAAAERARPEPVAVIGDSLDFTVIAELDKLEPIRVRLDDGSWNPYWIEQGDSMSFTAGDEFSLRRYLPRAGLRIESLDWPVHATGDYDTLIVSRQLVQERIDSLSALRGTR